MLLNLKKKGHKKKCPYLNKSFIGGDAMKAAPGPDASLEF